MIFVDDIPALKAVRADQANGVIRWVLTKTAWYYPDATSTDLADDDNVVQPTLGTGRWIRQRATSATSTTTDLTSENKTGDFTAQNGYRYVLNTDNLTPSTLQITLPTVVNNGDIFEIICDSNNGKLFRIIGTGTVKINGSSTSDFQGSVTTRAYYRVIYVGGNTEWLIIDLNPSVAGVKSLVSRSAPNFITRDWNGSGNFTYNLGLTDLLGRLNLDPLQPFSYAVLNDIYYTNRTITINNLSTFSTKNNNGIVNNTSQGVQNGLSFNYTSVHLNGTASILPISRCISVLERETSSTIRYIRPRALLIILTTDGRDFVTPASLSTNSVFKRMCIDFQVLAGRRRNIQSGFSYTSLYNLIGTTPFIKQTENLELLYSYDLVNFTITPIPSNVTILPNSVLPAPYNTPTSIGLYITLSGSITEKFYNHFLFDYNYTSDGSFNASSFTNSSNTTIGFAYFTFFGDIYEGT